MSDGITEHSVPNKIDEPVELHKSKDKPEMQSLSTVLEQQLKAANLTITGLENKIAEQIKSTEQALGTANQRILAGGKEIHYLNIYIMRMLGEKYLSPTEYKEAPWVKS